MGSLVFGRNGKSVHKVSPWFQLGKSVVCSFDSPPGQLCFISTHWTCTSVLKGKDNRQCCSLYVLYGLGTWDRGRLVGTVHLGSGCYSESSLMVNKCSLV